MGVKMKFKIIVTMCLIFLVGCRQDTNYDAILETGTKLQALDGGQEVKRSSDIFIYETRIDNYRVQVIVDAQGIRSEYNLADDTLQVDFLFDACTHSILIQSVYLDGEWREDLHEQLAEHLLTYLQARVSRDAQVIIDEYCLLVKGV